jgi:hypothetical protein
MMIGLVGPTRADLNPDALKGSLVGVAMTRERRRGPLRDRDGLAAAVR